MVKVSIICAVYNSENYLAQCLHSLVNQTMDDIEIILVDDASTDTSPEIIKSYKQSYPDKIKYIRLEENRQGIGVAYVGMDEAEGEYISIVNDDDYIDVKMIEKLYKKAKEEKDIDIVYCDYGVFSENEEVRRESYQIVQEPFTGTVTDEKRKCLLLCETYCWGQIIKKEIALLRFGIWDISIAPYRMLHVKRIVKVNEKLYFFRQREGSMSRNKNSYKTLYMYSNASLYLYLLAGLPDIEDKYREVLRARFILFFYYNQLKMCTAAFEHAPIDYMKYIRDTVGYLYPDYKENQYLINRLEPWQLELMSLNDVSPELCFQKSNKLVVQGTAIVAADMHRDYMGYYRKNTSKLQELFKYCKDNQYETVLWGMGERGNSFLECFHESITYVVDGDKQKQGKQIQYGKIIHAFEQIKDKVQVIFITNSGWVSNIKEIVTASDHAETIFLADIEMFIKYPVTAANCFIACSKLRKRKK